MSAPGLMHYFPDMQTLLAAVLDARDEEDLAALRLPKQPDARLLDLIDSALAYYAQRPAKVAQFDTLEIEALDPQHPAHDYFCLLYTSPSPRDKRQSRMPSSA